MAGNRFIWSSWSKKTKLEIFRNVDKVEDFLKSADEIAESGIATNELRRSAKKFTDKLSPGKIRNYLSKVDNIPRDTLIKDMESIGLKIKGNDKTRPFLEFVDHKGRLRAKIHPPDKATKHHHLHIYTHDGKPMTSALETIAGKKGYKSPDAHIPIKEP